MIISKLGSIKPNVKLVQQARPVSMSPLEIPVDDSPFLQLPSAEMVIASRDRGYDKDGKSLKSYKIIKKSKPDITGENTENSPSQPDKGFFVNILV